MKQLKSNGNAKIKTKNSFKTMLFVIAAASLMLTSACTRIESGQVGVQRDFSGEYSKEAVPVGIHATILDTIYPFSVREITIGLKDLKPTTKNNTSILSDLDFEVQYSINPLKVPDVAVKYGNMHQVSQNGTYLPAYDLVDKQAKSVSADAVAQFDALEISSKRNELEAIIKKNLQSDLDKNDPDTFYINRVSISTLLPDAKIQDSIWAIAESENRKQVAINNLAIAETEAKENRVRSESLDDKILAEKQLDAMVKMADKGNMIIIPVDFKGTVINNQKP